MWRDTTSLDLLVLPPDKDDSTKCWKAHRQRDQKHLHLQRDREQRYRECETPHPSFSLEAGSPIRFAAGGGDARSERRAKLRDRFLEGLVLLGLGGAQFSLFAEDQAIAEDEHQHLQD